MMFKTDSYPCAWFLWHFVCEHPSVVFSIDILNLFHVCVIFLCFFSFHESLKNILMLIQNSDYERKRTERKGLHFFSINIANSCISTKSLIMFYCNILIFRSLFFSLKMTSLFGRLKDNSINIIILIPLKSKISSLFIVILKEEFDGIEQYWYLYEIKCSRFTAISM